MSSTIELLRSKLEHAADRLARARRNSNAPSWRVLAQTPDGSSVRLRGHAARAFALAFLAAHSHRWHKARRSQAIDHLVDSGLLVYLGCRSYAVAQGARLSRIGIC